MCSRVEGVCGGAMMARRGGSLALVVLAFLGARASSGASAHDMDHLGGVCVVSQGVDACPPRYHCYEYSEKFPAPKNLLELKRRSRVEYDGVCQCNGLYGLTGPGCMDLSRGGVFLIAVALFLVGLHFIISWGSVALLASTLGVGPYKNKSGLWVTMLPLGLTTLSGFTTQPFMWGILAVTLGLDRAMEFDRHFLRVFFAVMGRVCMIWAVVAVIILSVLAGIRSWSKRRSPQSALAPKGLQGFAPFLPLPLAAVAATVGLLSSLNSFQGMAVASIMGIFVLGFVAEYLVAKMPSQQAEPSVDSAAAVGDVQGRGLPPSETWTPGGDEGGPGSRQASLARSTVRLYCIAVTPMVVGFSIHMNFRYTDTFLSALSMLFIFISDAFFYFLVIRFVLHRLVVLDEPSEAKPTVVLMDAWTRFPLSYFISLDRTACCLLSPDMRQFLEVKPESRLVSLDTEGSDGGKTREADEGVAASPMPISMANVQEEAIESDLEANFQSTDDPRLQEWARMLVEAPEVVIWHPAYSNPLPGLIVEEESGDY
mmetsp:Transcript_30841/g.89569  ORF Transcript_30841/g.89569 Transcript_30841/m.89569 type:complete len:540 (-) Transcript_30841:145-1764(-)